MKNILVTGGCGFIGSNFIRYILEDTDFEGKIVNIDSLTYAGNIESLIDIAEKYKGRYIFKRVDICDKEALETVFTDEKIDTICHFAAESHVDRSIVAPDDFIQTNIIGTYNLLNLAKTHQDELELFHHVSTDEVFGSLGAEGFFTETTRYKPNSPYSASKASSDHLVRAYNKTYKLPVTVSNCSNNYGPYQFPEKLIPLMILNALEGKSLPIYGDGKNVRDWLYVRDHCVAIWEIMKNGKRGETYNVGGNNEMQNIVVVETICDILDGIKGLSGSDSCKNLMTYVKDRPGHDQRYAIDFSKIKNELGWMPQESFESGIEKTVKWYLDNSTWIERIRSGEYLKWIKNQYE
ncbi:MAG: dTDP-glucose 4,6-dehydratase [Calditrichaeota bacterium]|nr:MAG: dTDP-glucose 4,6-dehydratase [Calditrichota bacterium]